MAILTPDTTPLPRAAGVPAVPSSAFPKNNTASDRGKKPPLPGENVPPTAEQTHEATDHVNRWLKLNLHSVRLVQDAMSGETIIHVVDKATGTIIRQIPAEEVIKLAEWWKNYSESNHGDSVSMLVNERA